MHLLLHRRLAENAVPARETRRECIGLAFLTLAVLSYPRSDARLPDGRDYRRGVDLAAQDVVTAVRTLDSRVS